MSLSGKETGKAKWQTHNGINQNQNCYPLNLHFITAEDLWKQPDDEYWYELKNKKGDSNNDSYVSPRPSSVRGLGQRNQLLRKYF